MNTLESFLFVVAQYSISSSQWGLSQSASGAGKYEQQTWGHRMAEG